MVSLGVRSLVLASALPCCLRARRVAAGKVTEASEATAGPTVESVLRPPTLFAGIRRPISSRAELEPRIAALESACRGRIAGPLTHIFRFDTPVQGYDSEIGYPVTEEVTTDEILTHTLREMHFYKALHVGPHTTIRDTVRVLHGRLDAAGLSPELELVERYLDRDLEHPERSRTEVMVSYLAWPEVYREQLERVLGTAPAAAIWEGGDRITPFTPVDERCLWVAATIERLRAVTTLEQQFDVLSRVALVRPAEDVAPYKELYERTGDVDEVIQAQGEKLATGPSGGYVDPPSFDGKILHMSKVPYDRKAYDSASNATERRRAFCFCALVREAEDPHIDPIFCYRAAGWSRQFWEPILGVEFERCEITHSILKGDPFCAWDYHLL
jgi:hypothetical protein